jgi:hypothetical protein
MATEVLDGLARSRLLPKLRSLSLGGQKVEPTSLRPRHGVAFDHLEELKLPAERLER